MKHYIIYTLFFGYLSISILGTTGDTFTSTANLEDTYSNATKLEESFSNATNSEEMPENATDLEKSPSSATESKISPPNVFHYDIQNETDTKLEQEFKVAIKGGKGKGKITGGGNKNKITGGNKNKITGGNKNKITGGYKYKRITSDNRYTKSTSGNNDWPTALYYLGISLAGGVAIVVIAYGGAFIYEIAKEKFHKIISNEKDTA